MKQKNEEILARWRAIGFLDGLKIGSINEWRCAKSYNDMANYLLSDILSYDYSTILTFPFIRRVLCTRKKRLYRLIKPSEVINFLNTTTIEECFRFYGNSELQNITTPKSVKEVKKILLYKILSYEKFKNETLSIFFTKLYLEKDNLYKELKYIVNNIIDIEIEILVLACDLFVEKNTQKKE